MYWTCVLELGNVYVSYGFVCLFYDLSADRTTFQKLIWVVKTASKKILEAFTLIAQKLAPPGRNLPFQKNYNPYYEIQKLRT